ncbi:unnamed protein product [Spirodela intermedia]|uniref:Uncharacterized protein n=1 Tax=Spirodela intermedia TaxID=51605 RepID=A0A7I8KYF0_SPIIN|nr:unnamed protein product [Spirodela intermedia]
MAAVKKRLTQTTMLCPADLVSRGKISLGTSHPSGPHDHPAARPFDRLSPWPNFSARVTATTTCENPPKKSPQSRSPSHSIDGGHGNQRAEDEHGAGDDGGVEGGAGAEPQALEDHRRIEEDRVHAGELLERRDAQCSND